MKPIIALPALALLVACQTTAQTPNADRTSYNAHGTEPFWGLTLKDGVMTFSSPDAADVRVTDYQARPSFNGWRYTSAKLTADVTFSSCSDGMSDLTYKDTVTVMVGKREYKGCGGTIIEPESLEGTNWRVTHVNGVQIPLEHKANIAFENGRMSGSVGCNRLGADYQYKNHSVSFGPVMSTRMACPDPIGRLETIFVKVLGEYVETGFYDDGRMVLTGQGGNAAVLERLN